MRGCAITVAVSVLAIQLLWVFVIAALMIQYAACNARDCDPVGPSLLIVYALLVQLFLTPFSVAAAVVAFIAREE